MAEKVDTSGRVNISFPHYLKVEYDQYFNRAQKATKIGTYNYYDLFTNILVFLKAKGFDPTKQY